MTLALGLLAAASCASAPPPCDSYCQHQRRATRACEAGDAAACFAMADFSLGGEEALVEKACRMGHGPACTKAGDALADLHRPEKEKTAAALELYARGCDAGESGACTRGARLLLAAGRAGEVRAWVGPACERGDGPSCRELGRSLAFGIGGEPDLGRGEALLTSACERGDHEACALEAFLLAAGREPERAQAILSKSCDAGVKRSCAIARALAEIASDQGGIGVVLSRAPIVVELAGEQVAPLHAEVSLSVGGPFELGPIQTDWIGIEEGAVRESSPGRVVFRGEAMSILRMVWLPGDLVWVGWDARRDDLTQAQCEADYGCRHRGFCTLVDGRCTRASAADCARLEGCTSFGRCGYDAGDCVATEEGCRASSGCREGGRCRLDGSFCSD